MELRGARQYEGLWAVQDRSAHEFHAMSLDVDQLPKELGKLAVVVGQLQGKVLELRRARVAVDSKPPQDPGDPGKKAPTTAADKPEEAEFRSGGVRGTLIGRRRLFLGYT